MNDGKHLALETVKTTKILKIHTKTLKIEQILKFYISMYHNIWLCLIKLLPSCEEDNDISHTDVESLVV